MFRLTADETESDENVWCTLAGSTQEGSPQFAVASMHLKVQKRSPQMKLLLSRTPADA